MRESEFDPKKKSVITSAKILRAGELLFTKLNLGMVISEVKEIEDQQ
jgi:hypothetical protein